MPKTPPNLPTPPLPLGHITKFAELTYDQLLENPEHSPSHTDAHYRIANVVTGEIVWQRPKAHTQTYVEGRPHWVYQPSLVDELCEAIAAGGSLTLLCDGVRFPKYAELCRWRRHWPEITQQLETARRDRAERMRDLAMIHAMEATDKNDTPAAQLKSEIHKWAASVDDVRYRQNAKVDVSLNAPTQIIVQTGIERGTK